MVRFIEQIVIPKEAADEIDYLLTNKPITEDECLGEDIAIRYTKRFYKTPMSMDIKLCGVQFEEGNSNLPWTEAVLYENNEYDEDIQVAYTEPSDEFFGEWEIEYNGIIYVVNVKKGE